MPNLIVVSGLRSGTILPIGERVVLGRNADVDLRLPDLLVSGRHAEILAATGGYAVNDLASTNGTFVNGAKLLAGGPLKLEDILTVGSTDILFTESAEYDPKISRDLHDALVTAEDPSYEVRLLAEVEDGLRLDETRTFGQKGLSQALPIVNAVQRAFSLAGNLSQLLDRVAQQLTLAVGGRGVVIALAGDEGMEIALRAQVQDAEVFRKEELDFSVREDLLERALAKRNILLARGGPDNTGTAVIGPGDGGPPPLPALCISLPSAAEIVGAVYVHGARENLDKNDLRLLFLIAALAGVNIRSHLLLAQVRSQNEELARAVSARTAELSRADRSALLLSGILETVPEAVVSTTLEGVVTTWNRGAEDLYGFAASEVIGELLPTIPDHRGLELDRVLEAAAEGRSLSLRTERVTRDDREVPIVATYAPVPGPDGAGVAGLVEIARELTEQLRDEDRLRWQTRLASFGELAAGLAHELGGPLTNLRSGVDFLLARERSPEATKESLQVLRAEIERLHRLVQQALDLARWQAPSPRPCDCGELLDYVTSQLSARAGEQKVELVRTPAAGPVSVAADPDQIKQALLNLASNALESMPDGGTLELSLVDEGESCGFLVRDTGSGIPPEYQDKVFNLFFSRRSGGSGVGLAMVKRIIDLHAGEIVLESGVNEGTTIRLLLPRTEAGQR